MSTPATPILLPTGFEVTCPCPSTLKTGDLLFPRPPKNARGNTGARFAAELLAERIKAKSSAVEKTDSLRVTMIRWGEKTGQQDLIKSLLAEDERVASHNEGIAGATFVPRSASGLELIYGPNQPRGSVWELMRQPNWAHLESGVDLEDPALFYSLKAILKSEFPDITVPWLDMQVDEFLNHPITKFLLSALTAADVRDSFFVGHVAMVICEPDGRPFVIEANATDFSHYRVAIHPYFVEGEATTVADELAVHTAEKMAGWVNRRCALGEHVWHARINKAIAEPHDWPADEIVRKAKELLGRPYGFFDYPTFGNTSRLYCAELIVAVFERAIPAIRLKDTMKWGWMRDYLKASNQTKEYKLVVKIMLDHRFPDDRDFFVMPPAMLWNSASLAAIFKPGDEEYAERVAA